MEMVKGVTNGNDLVVKAENACMERENLLNGNHIYGGGQIVSVKTPDKTLLIKDIKAVVFGEGLLTWLLVISLKKGANSTKIN